MPGTTARTAPALDARLTGYVAGLLPLSDWHRAREIAADVVAATAGTAPLTPAVDSESGLPEHLAAAARAAAREHAAAPWLTADDMFVRVRRPHGGDRLLAAVLHSLHATDGPPHPVLRAAA
ncbi:hypothetical protein [Streptomyces bohaiensis]|uniref:Uncharacterized protein n=1 Tax=Streptomyces bohaiensis TaxID=1431344 RepID=A0ABX1C7F6_9ACTN|nr:hypothetical protein [Streptomyces bohaiensis]NJQ13510.1 hypothetical protein [Streptomyces bohaiensis]